MLSYPSDPKSGLEIAHIVFLSFLTVANQPVVAWLGGYWYPQPTGVEVLDLTFVLAFSWTYFRPSGDVSLVGGYVPADHKGV